MRVVTHFEPIFRTCFVLLLACSELITIGCSAIGPATSVQQAPQTSVSQSVYTASPISQIVPSTAVVSNNYFGMHIHRLANPADPSQVTPFPSFPVSVLRLWDSTTWYSLEPTPGNPQWLKLDETISAATANGVNDFVFTFGYVPGWASSNPAGSCDGAYTGSCFPPDLSSLDQFTSDLVKRYCGKIRYYETWNEPNLSLFWKGSDAQLLEIAQQIHAIVKDPSNCGCTAGTCSPGGGANPNKVLLPSINSLAPNSLGWLEHWLGSALSPYPYADIASFHGYGYENNPENIRDGVQSLRTTLNRLGLANLELWNTEASWGRAQNQTQEQQAAWLMRYQTIQAATGVSRFMWYAYDNCDWGSLWGSSCGTPSDAWIGPREPATAYATVQQWLTGAKIEYCEFHVDTTWLCRLTRSGDYVGWIAWNSSQASTSMTVPSTLGLVQYRDWQNQPHVVVEGSVSIGPMPLLLENKSAF